MPTSRHFVSDDKDPYPNCNLPTGPWGLGRPSCPLHTNHGSYLRRDVFEVLRSKRTTDFRRIIPSRRTRCRRDAITQRLALHRVRAGRLGDATLPTSPCSTLTRESAYANSSAPSPGPAPRRTRSSWPPPAHAGYDRARPIRAPLARWSAAPGPAADESPPESRRASAAPRPSGWPCARWRCAARAHCRARDGSPESGRPKDRKSTRLNSSHLGISYAGFCLEKKRDHCGTTQATGQRKKQKGKQNGIGGMQI